jgi:hypothetical protein
MNTAPAKRSGRPKVSPSELCLRRIGKSFEAADQLLTVYQSGENVVRDKGRGKQPFNSYIKSLQEKVAMYKSYLELLFIQADSAGYEFDVEINITEDDKEKPWKKLKSFYRDANNESLSLEKEFAERQKVFSGSREDYNKDYPYIEWCGFWFESELNAAQRISGQAIMSFDLLGVDFISLDDALSSEQAKKGRQTFVNKQGKNKKDIFAAMHSKIVRYKNRLRQTLEEIGYTPEEFDKLDIADIIVSDKSGDTKKLKSASNLHTKIEVMENDLNNALLSASREDALNFKLSMTKKKLLPLTKKANAGTITPLEKIKAANIKKEIADIRLEVKALSKLAV